MSVVSVIMAHSPSSASPETDALSGLEPVALTVQWAVGEDWPVKGSLPTDSIWGQWFNRWWSALTVEELPYLAPVLEAVPKGDLAIAVNLRFVTDSDICQLNRDYRNSDRPTDVLAFSALEAIPPAILMAQVTEGLASNGNPDSIDPDPIELGDIIISLDTAQTQAQSLGHGLSLELAWLAAHGFLHLLGWDHPDRNQLEQMLTCQQTLLTAANLGTVNWGALDMAEMGYG